MIIKKKKDPELLRKLEQRSREQPKLIEPIVNDIFNECLAKDQDYSLRTTSAMDKEMRFINNGRIEVRLMLNVMGFERDSSPVFFDIDKIESYRKGINYLFGQLKAVHDGDPRAYFADMAVKYGKYGLWTDDTASVAALLYLGEAAGAVAFIMKTKDEKIIVSLNDIAPVYDPDDKEHAE